jgi:hypothetical protein
VPWNRSLEKLRRTITRDLQDAERNQHSVVIGPLFITEHQAPGSWHIQLRAPGRLNRPPRFTM